MENLNEESDVTKFLAPAVVLAAGCFISTLVAQGIFVGALTVGGLYITLNRFKEYYPAFYNWILDHSIAADMSVTVLAAIVLGFSVTGLIGAAAANIFSSMMFDYLRTKGKATVPEKQGIKDLLKSGVAKAKESFAECQNALKEVVSNKPTKLEVVDAAAI